MINNIIMLINELNLNKKKNKKFFITKINKNKINLLKIFLKYNIISYFIILENNIKVFLNNNNKLKIEIYSSKNNQKYENKSNKLFPPIILHLLRPCNHTGPFIKQAKQSAHEQIAHNHHRKGDSDVLEQQVLQNRVKTFPFILSVAGPHA